MLPEAFRATGGIQAYLRLLLRALQDSEQSQRLECEALLLNDHEEDLERNFFGASIKLSASGGSRPRFVASANFPSVALAP